MIQALALRAAAKSIGGFVTTHWRLILMAAAIIGVILLARWLYQEGRSDERAAWEASTAAAEKHALQETIDNQRKAHEIHNRNASLPDGDAWRVLIQNWAR